MPKAVFNVCNSAVFLWTIFSAYEICNVGKKRSVLIFAVILMCFWNYVPVIGPVCLWQVGAINYLWAVAFCLFFLRPYLSRYFRPEGGRWFASRQVRGRSCCFRSFLLSACIRRSPLSLAF